MLLRNLFLKSLFDNRRRPRLVGPGGHPPLRAHDLLLSQHLHQRRPAGLY